jgi:hypothetical protein
VSTENEHPPPDSTNPANQDESARADGAHIEPARPVEEPGVSSIVRWSQRHAEAARAARAGATRRSNGSLPDSIVRWSQRHSGTAKTAMARGTDASKSAESNAAGPKPARPPLQPIRTPSGRGRTGTGVIRPLLSQLANLITTLGWLIALLMVVYILFVILRANPSNPWAAYVESWAPRMNLGVGDLVAVANPTIKVLITYGVAAILWAVIGTVVGWLIRRTAAP